LATFHTGWWFGPFLFFHILGIIIIPTHELIFFRGGVLPPTSIAFSKIAEPVNSLRTLSDSTPKIGPTDQPLQFNELSQSWPYSLQQTGEAPKHGQVDKSKAFTELPSALDSIRSSAQISSHTTQGKPTPLIPSH